MNIPSRATHEGRSLWTVASLEPEAATQALAALTRAPLVPLECKALAAAGLAGAAHVVAATAAPTRGLRTPGGLTGPGDDAVAPVLLTSHPVTATAPPLNWLRATCDVANGGEDVLLLGFDGPPPPARLVLRDLALWPSVRRRCLEGLALPDAVSGPSGTAEAGLLWMVLARIPAAVLVVTMAGLILRMNPQARALIHEGRVLTRGRGGLTAATDKGTRLLRDAVRVCLCRESSEVFLLLPTSDGSRVPVTVARFAPPGSEAALATVLVPVPPGQDQVERVARELGLTVTEARVAALMQQGLSNRVAAQNMGVQEQSFATYSKRVLSKLNLTSRAEIAQMLTWQASLPAPHDEVMEGQ